MPFHRLFNSSPSNEWISPLITVSRGLVSVGNCTPFPYVNTALSAGVALLELIQTVGKTTDDLKYLAESIVTIMKLLREEMEAHSSPPDAKFLKVCIEFNLHLTRLSKDIESMSKDWSASKFKKYIKVNCVRDEIAQFTRRVSDLRADATLIAATGTRMDLAEVANAISTVKSGVSQIQTELAAISSPATTDRSQDLVRFEENFHALKMGDIHLEFQTARTSDYKLEDVRTRARVQIGWTDYKGHVRGSPHTIRVYRGSDASESWKEVLSFLAEHWPSPGLPQLFGFCSSPRFRALVFHAWEVTLCSDYEDLDEFYCQRGLYNLYDARNFALVDARNGKLMITYLETSPNKTVRYPFDREPFLEWFNTSDSVGSRILRSSASCTSLEAELLKLTQLMRTTSMGFNYINHSFYETFTSPGGVYHFLAGNIFARFCDCKPAVDTAWQVVQTWWSGDEVPPRDYFPHTDPQTDSGWTHFVLPLMKKGNNWNSLLVREHCCGYFLTAKVECGVNVPNVGLAWMAQSWSFSTDAYILSQAEVPIQTTLELTWEMVLSEETADSLALLETLPDLHVFIHVPILDCGQIPEPRIYWSTDPEQKDTSRIPSGIFQIRLSWRPIITVVKWKHHHYDVAKSVLEKWGFDPSTNAAANALGLPLLESCDPTFVRLLNDAYNDEKQLRFSQMLNEVRSGEDEWCNGKVVKRCPHAVYLEG
ncbi:hypothetical protein B0H19DRAFT_654980 [Mycena capillaripes]|nr:hypothetical protein B0H19DRAFT_654980 [Mycena capillaripes]